MSSLKDLFQEFNKGDIVVLDKGRTNQSLVEVVSQTKNKMFSLVSSNGVQWEVMTNRLSYEY